MTELEAACTRCEFDPLLGEACKRIPVPGNNFNCCHKDWEIITYLHLAEHTLALHLHHDAFFLQCGIIWHTTYL
jgi:hypothetical protein